MKEIVTYGLPILWLLFGFIIILLSIKKDDGMMFLIGSLICIITTIIITKFYIGFYLITALFIALMI